jgi:hypothetical protein
VRNDDIAELAREAQKPGHREIVSLEDFSAEWCTTRCRSLLPRRKSMYKVGSVSVNTKRSTLLQKEN